MFSLLEMQKIAENQNTLFYKPNCPFCIASQGLLDQLVNLSLLDSYKIYTLNIDFNNQALTDLTCIYGWQPDGVQSVCTKPQIFIKGEYIGGNFEFYKSKWNVDAGYPNLKNPMRF